MAAAVNDWPAELRGKARTLTAVLVHLCDWDTWWSPSPNIPADRRPAAGTLAHRAGMSERSFWRALHVLYAQRVVIDTRRNGCHPNSYLLDPERILALAVLGKAERRAKVALLEESARTTWRELADQARAEVATLAGELTEQGLDEGLVEEALEAADAGLDAGLDEELVEDEAPEAAPAPAGPPAWLLEAVRRRADWSTDREGWAARAWAALSLVLGRLAPSTSPEALGHLRRRSMRWWVDQGTPAPGALAPRLELILAGLAEDGCTKAGPLPVLRALPEVGRLGELLLGATWAEAEAQARAHHSDGCRCSANAGRVFEAARRAALSQGPAHPVISIPSASPPPLVATEKEAVRGRQAPEDRGARSAADLPLPLSFEGTEARSFKVRDGATPAAWSMGLRRLRYATDAQGQVWAVAPDHGSLASARLHLATLERVLPELVGVVS